LQEIEFSSIPQLLQKQLSNNNLLEKNGVISKLESLNNLWLNLPSGIRKKPQNVLSYAELLVELDDMDEAEKLIKPLFKKELEKETSLRLINLYGNINSVSIDQQFSLLENWHHKHDDSPNVIYSALGKIAYNASLWGKARFYFERSLRTDPSAETYLMMAKTLSKMDDEELADETYRKGLEFVVQPQLANQTLLLEKNADNQNLGEQQPANILPKLENNT
jgi:HemY protein